MRGIKRFKMEVRNSLGERAPDSFVKGVEHSEGEWVRHKDIKALLVYEMKGSLLKGKE